jgi:hypothetical protein
VQKLSCVLGKNGNFPSKGGAVGAAAPPGSAPGHVISLPIVYFLNMIGSHSWIDSRIRQLGKWRPSTVSNTHEIKNRSFGEFDRQIRQYNSDYRIRSDFNIIPSHGNQSEAAGFCRLVGSYKIRSNPVSD